MITTSCAGRPALPVGKIVGIGRNYADHVKEMGHGAGATAPDAGATLSEPLLFLKPSTALVPGGGEIELPRFSREVHHEVELVVRIGAGGRDLGADAAARAVDACAVGLDLTARDLQTRARQKGEPWAVAKGFDGSAPLSPLLPVDDLRELAGLDLLLAVNGTVRQRGSTAQMLWDVGALVRFVSTRFRLEPGDLLFTGTPAGVGPLVAGDRVRATLAREGRELLLLEIRLR